MAGTLAFQSLVPVTSNVFPLIYVGTSTEAEEEGLGFPSSLAADEVWRGAAALPIPLPTGTLKLRGALRANATTGDAKLHVKWARVAYGADFGAVTLSNETVQTYTWAAGDAHEDKEFVVTLDAVTPVAGESLRVDIVGEASGWTLAAALGIFRPRLVWED